MDQLNPKNFVANLREDGLVEEDYDATQNYSFGMKSATLYAGVLFCIAAGLAIGITLTKVLA